MYILSFLIHNTDPKQMADQSSRVSGDNTNDSFSFHIQYYNYNQYKQQHSWLLFFGLCHPSFLLNCLQNPLQDHPQLLSQSLFEATCLQPSQKVIDSQQGLSSTLSSLSCFQSAIRLESEPAIEADGLHGIVNILKGDQVVSQLIRSCTSASAGSG